MRRTFSFLLVLLLPAICVAQQSRRPPEFVNLPNGKVLGKVAGVPRAINSMPATIAVSPDQRYAVTLNMGWGTVESDYHQSLTVLDLKTDKLTDFPDARLGHDSRQTYFIGLAFSADGARLYASLASETDAGGNGIAVYSFRDGVIAPQRFIKIPPQPVAPGKIAALLNEEIGPHMQVPYPAGLAVIGSGDDEKLLVADDISDDALLISTKTGEVLKRFDLSVYGVVPGSYPYTAVATKDGSKGWVSLWNASRVAELDLRTGAVTMIPILPPEKVTDAGSHPSAMALSQSERGLYVLATNAGAVVSVNTETHMPSASVPLAGADTGSAPISLAIFPGGRKMAVALAGENRVIQLGGAGPEGEKDSGEIATEDYPVGVAYAGDDLIISTAKGRGIGPNARLAVPQIAQTHKGDGAYIGSMTHGSLVRVRNLGKWSEYAAPKPEQVHFKEDKNPIKHVIYILRENRTYDQLLGDLGVGNGDKSLAMFGWDITPNLHRLALEFGVLDNFYDSGEVSGNGHYWSTAATTTDYLEKTWPIGYRGRERTYDYDGRAADRYPLLDKMPDPAEPMTGYIWGLVARHGLTYRHYGEFVDTLWCEGGRVTTAPRQGPTGPVADCAKKSVIAPGEPLPDGRENPWPWPIPVIAYNVATKPELVGHYDAAFPDFRLDYPDQLRADEFLREFAKFVEARKSGTGEQLPGYVLLRLPDDHTSGMRAGAPSPAAAVADNDLATGRVVDAVSHSPYWDDTAIVVLEDDAQDGVDHVDAHRSIALIISKYSPSTKDKPVVDSGFYTTVHMMRTIEALLGLPPMNGNDAAVAPISSLFQGMGTHAAFTVDYRNRDNKLIYNMNPQHGPGAKESAALDLSHADAADTQVLNRVVWRSRMGKKPMPKARHNVFPAESDE
jgi:DNA-binding beta-propeller fold protein YncE